MPGGITGRPSGSITGTPGGVPGGITGISGGITGSNLRPGGASGISGGITVPTIPGRGRLTPTRPLGGGSFSETVWTCTGCNGELGRGPNDPGQTVCPHCGAHLSGTVNAPISGGNSAPPSAPAAAVGGAASAAAPAAPESDTPKNTSRVWTIIGIAVGVIFFTAVAAMLCMVVANSSSRRPALRRRPVSLDDD
jgi:hypothetical protein